MHIVQSTLAIALLAAVSLPAGQAAAHDKEAAARNRRPPVIIRDRSLGRPPPLPHERTYVGPGPTVVPPMERIPPPAPLSQPPIR
jgi:hypothetical protein